MTAPGSEAPAPRALGDAVAVIAIGRNEGERLVRCLRSAAEAGDLRLVYVDSGSRDDSVANAERLGAQVVVLDPDIPFTAARARNAGFAALRAAGADPDYVQFVDGDCELRADWLAAARRFLDDTPEAAVVCGRRRERFPERSVYNRICDREWNTPVGRAKACGGDAMMRVAAFEAVGGYRDDLIAGEEPELCVRLRQAGWAVWRIDREMTLHDAAMTRFGQFWKRAVRGGHAFAEGAALHGAPPERHWVIETVRALAWGLALPVAIVAATIATPYGALLALAYPAQVVRLARRAGWGRRDAWAFSALDVVGKIAEAVGVLTYLRARLTARKTALIEHK